MRQLIWLGDRLRLIREFCEDQWFDRTRHVRTSGDVSPHNAGISQAKFRDSEGYVPARPRHIREALSATPVRDVSGYTYIDMGSGKGRTLFVAAELPFRQIIGIELSNVLHQQACVNIQSFRSRKKRCGHIKAIEGNAAEFAFPDNRIVLYLFNPFGADTMQQVMNNLQASLQRVPRHVVVILLWPRAGDLVLGVDGMRMVRSTQRHQIFEFSVAEPSRH